MTATAELKYIGKYEVLASLGRGSMGVVYKAQDPEIGRIVAIKTLRTVFMSDDAAGSEAMQRFRQESRSAGKLHHKSIVTIFEAGRTDNGSPYIVMEFIDGKSLETIIAERSPLDPTEAVHYMMQVASALDYAHSQNVIHRDIKPSNIIIDSQFHPRLVDFGVAKLSDTSLTPAGTVVGTPSYMSPEQIRGEELNGKADLFAFAVLTFEVLTGVRPFPGNDFTTVVSNIIQKEPLTLQEAKSSLPSALEPVLHKALSKDRNDRYPTGQEFIRAVAGVLGLRVEIDGLFGGFRPGMKYTDLERAGALNPSTDKSDSLSGSQNSTDLRTEASIERSDDVRSAVFGESQPRSGSSTFAAVVSITLYLGLLLAICGGVLFLFFPDLIPPAIAAKLGLNVSDRNISERSEDITVVEKSEKTPSTQSSGDAGNAASTATADRPAAETSPVTDIPSTKPTTEVPLLDALIPTPPLIPEGGFTALTLGASSDGELLYLLSSPSIDADTLRLVVREAGKRTNPSLVMALAGTANNPNYVVRIEVLKAFTAPSLKNDAVALATVKAHLADSDNLVRAFSAKALCLIIGAQAVPYLEERIKVETDPVVTKVLTAQLQAIRPAQP